jgi:hypothetical protein
MLVPSPAAEYLFPKALAEGISQVTSATTIEGMATQAGRDCIVLRVEYPQANGTPGTRIKLWVDASTGVVLQYQLFTAITGWDKWVSQTRVDSIAYDVLLDNSQFAFRPDQNFTQVAYDELR